MEAIGYAKFEEMRDAGLGPKEATSVAIADGLDFVENLLMLRAVFNVDLVPAKEAWFQAKGTSLDEHQQGLLPEIEQVLDQLNEDHS